MDTCNICDGNLERQHITFTQWYAGKLFVIEHVPAWVCEKCGDTAFDPAVVEQIQNLIWSGKAPIRHIEAAVYDLDLEKA
jgi:YgiT-type zinc finger domain-containing protein